MPRFDDLMVPQPPRDPAEGMREALRLHDEGVAIERLRLAREGLTPEAIDAKIDAWLAESPTPGAGVPGFRRGCVRERFPGLG